MSNISVLLIADEEDIGFLAAAMEPKNGVRRIGEGEFTVGHSRYVATTLQQALATPQISKEGLAGIVPPRLAYRELCAPFSERHARFDIKPGILCSGMQHQHVDALGKGTIGDGFECGRIVLPGCERPASEALAIEVLASLPTHDIAQLSDAATSPMAGTCPELGAKEYVVVHPLAYHLGI